MGHRKFLYNDVVTVLPWSDYEAHVGHIGRITAVRIEKREAKKGTKVNYHVSCSCGKDLIPEAAQLDIVSGLEDDISVHESRMIHFVQLAGLTPDKSILKKQVHQALKKSVSGFIKSFDKDRHRSLLIRHFGLDGNPGKSQQELAEEEQVSYQRMQAMLSKVIINLRKEKHED